MKRTTYKRGQYQFEPQNVRYLIGEANYSNIHLLTGEVILSCRTLKWFEDQWPTFLRLHKSALVNIDHINYCKLADTPRGVNYVVMSDSAELVVSRRRISEVVSEVTKLKKEVA